MHIKCHRAVVSVWHSTEPIRRQWGKYLLLTWQGTKEKARRETVLSSYSKMDSSGKSSAKEMMSPQSRLSPREATRSDWLHWVTVLMPICCASHRQAVTDILYAAASRALLTTPEPYFGSIIRNFLPVLMIDISLICFTFIPGWLQASIWLRVILTSGPPECWDCRYMPPCLTFTFISMGEK